jgi:peptidyl-Lys metalloendopeptidase
MSTKLRGQFKHWCVAGLVGVSMLGACGAPEERTEAPAAAREAAEGDVSVSVSVGKSALRASDDVLVTVTLTNVSKSPVSLLKWHTPEDGIKDALFSVTRDGAPVAYIGRHYKRGAPQVTDYVTLASGESLTRTVNLAHAYDLSQTGSYSLRYELDADHSGGFGVAALRSSDLTVWVEGRQSGAPELLAQAGTVSAQALSYAGACTSTEQSSIASAFNSAKTYSNNSLSYLTNTTPGNTSRYKTWFGSYTSTNWNTVKTHFSKIKTAFDTASVVVDCSCNDSAYAYVYPSSPYRIYVCNAFWSAPTTGTDSKAGTLVHEMSHFTVVAGTDDWAYGQSAAKSLAISNPTRAVDNADSHEYFAENTPALP